MAYIIQNIYDTKTEQEFTDAVAIAPVMRRPGTKTVLMNPESLVTGIRYLCTHGGVERITGISFGKSSSLLKYKYKVSNEEHSYTFNSYLKEVPV